MRCHRRIGPLPRRWFAVLRLQQNVVWLDVTMNDPASVRETQRPRYRLRDLDGLLHRELLLATQLVAEGLALDVGHDVVQERVGYAGIVERQDVGMLQVGGDFNLLEKPLGSEDGRQLRT